MVRYMIPSMTDHIPKWEFSIEVREKCFFKEVNGGVRKNFFNKALNLFG